MWRIRKVRSAALWLALASAAASVGGVVQLTGAAPAGAVTPPALHKVTSPATSTAPGRFKIQYATCGANERVVGGGGWADDFGANQVRLTVLRPSDNASASTFTAAAEAPPGYSGPWLLQAYAICAPRSSLAGYQIVETPNPVRSTDPLREATARCPGTKRALGTGAQIYGTGLGQAGGQVGLQMTRTSAPMDISRALAREAVESYPGLWTLTSYAVCVNPLPGQRYETQLFPGKSSEDIRCPTIDGRPTYVHGAGAGASGWSWLQVVYPSNDLRQVQVLTTRSGDPDDSLLAHAVCAY